MTGARAADTDSERPSPTILERLNPVTPFGAAVLFSTPMLTTIDVGSAAAGLAATLVLIAVARVSLRSVVARCWPLFIAAPVSAVSMLLYAEPSGTVHARFWLAEISDGSIALSIAIGLRVLAIGMPTLIILGGIDPTRLADGLAQVVRLPSRFVLGALAGVRLFTVFQDDWTALEQARRARGLGDGGRLRRLGSMSFALLVLALRRGGDLATAMEARAFGGGARTWARPSTMAARDWIFLALALAAGLAAIGVGMMMGTYRLVGSGMHG